MQDREKGKAEAGEIVVTKRFLKWLDNFWYHYKWTVIVVGFFALVFIVCFSQCVQKVDINIPVVYAGGYQSVDAERLSWTEEDRAAIKNVLASLYRKAGGDEGKNVGFITYNIYTEEQLRAMATEPPEKEGESEKFSPYAFNAAKQNNIAEFDAFVNYMGTGECSIWLLSEYVYEEKRVWERAMPLAELFGEDIPEGAYDDYAIRLGDTALYRYYDALRVLPEDTLILLTRGWVMGASSDAETYESYVKLYRAMVEFETP